MTMAQAFSLHLGLNYVGPAHYTDSNGNGWDGQLFGCENDARDMAELAQQQGFKHSEVALTREVTANFVKRKLLEFADEMQPDDLFLLTYSGHGGQVTDLDGDEFKNRDDRDGQDEKRCLYDRQLLDDELNVLWPHFPERARLLVLPDSCHSGTVVRDRFYGTTSVSNCDGDGRRFHFMPSTTAKSTERRNHKLYQDVDLQVAEKKKQLKGKGVRACVRLISGCQSDRYSQDLASCRCAGVAARRRARSWANCSSAFLGYC